MEKEQRAVNILKIFIILASILIIHLSVYSDNSSEKAPINNRDVENAHKGMYVRASLDIGSGPYGTLTYSLGYIKKQVNKNTCIYLNGTYTENVKLGYLVFERTFNKERGLFFWGYYFGGGYVRWEYGSWNLVKGEEMDTIESWLPFIGTKLGLRFKIFQNTYINISTEIISLKYPISIISISIQ